MRMSLLPGPASGVRRWLGRGALLTGLLAIALAGWWLLRPASTPQADPAANYGAAVGGPFLLTGTDGRPFDSARLAGRPFAIFFGFTRCPDVCPTTLSRLAVLRARLGDDGGRFDIVFISVDPEADTPEQIGRYLALFDMPVIGLTGTPQQLAAARRAYAVHAERVPLAGGGYTIDHTASVFLMGRRGEFVSAIDMHEGDEPALAKLRRLIRS